MGFKRISCDSGYRKPVVSSGLDRTEVWWIFQDEFNFKMRILQINGNMFPFSSSYLNSQSCQNSSVCSLLSGWATTTGWLLDPRKQRYATASGLFKASNKIRACSFGFGPKISTRLQFRSECNILEKSSSKKHQPVKLGPYVIAMHWWHWQVWIS